MRGQHKIIFTGPVGAGKTTAISAISDIEPITTDEKASDMASSRKEHGHTTVVMDYGLIKLDDRQTVHLYGTPGQQRFDFMWDILARGGLGLVLLVDNSRPNPFQDMAFFINSFRDLVDKAPLVIGVTKRDLRWTPTIDQYNDHLGGLGFRGIPVFDVDGRQKEDIKILILALLYYLDPGLGERS